MAIDPTLMPALRNQRSLEGRPLADAAFLYQPADGSIWLDTGVIGTEPELIQPAPPPVSPPPPAV